MKDIDSRVGDEGLRAVILSRIAQTTHKNNSCDDKNESYLEWQKHHAQLEDQTDVLTGNLNILYACESRTLTAELERRIQTTEMKSYRRLLGISYKDHITNVEVRNKIIKAVGPHEDFLTTVKRGN